MKFKPIRRPLTFESRRALVLLGLLLICPLAALSQSDSPASTTAPDAENQEPSVTMFPHELDSRFWISGQANIIFQWHPSFPAKYSGPNSLREESEHATSNVLTLYTGYEFNKTTEIVFDIESAGGRGISSALGVAGFTNLDVVRNPDLGQTPYLARLMVRKIIPLSHESEKAERDPLSLATSLPLRRLDIRVGKFSLVDFFDANSVGSDSHLQFMNWTDDNNGAYDYAANTRGYTWGAMIEYQDRRWGRDMLRRRCRKSPTGPIWMPTCSGPMLKTLRLSSAVNSCPAGREQSGYFRLSTTATWATIATPSIYSGMDELQTRTSP